MKRLSIAGIAGLLLIAAAPSASAIEVWQGDLFITTANNSCVNAGWTVNRFFDAVLRPNDLEDNGTNTLLALFQERYAARYVVAGALAGNGTYNARHITSTAGGGGGPSGGLWSANFSVASLKPVPAVGRPSVKVRVRFTRFADTAGCTVTLQGTLGLRPNL